MHDYRLCLLGGIAASHHSCSRTCKLQDVNAISVFKTMFIVLVSQGKSRKSREKCWDLKALTAGGAVCWEGKTTLRVGRASVRTGGRASSFDAPFDALSLAQD